MQSVQAQGKRIDGFGVSCTLSQHEYYPEVYIMSTTYAHGGETVQRYEIIPVGDSTNGLQGLAFELMRERMTEFTVKNWDYIFEKYTPIAPLSSLTIRWVADLFQPQNIPALYNIFKSANVDFFRSNHWQNVLITHQCMIMGYDAQMVPEIAIMWMVYILTERAKEFSWGTGAGYTTV